MSLKANKTLALRFYYEIFNEGNLDLFDEVFAADYVSHASPPAPPTGVAGTRRFVITFRTAFPDVHITVDDLISQGDRVVVRWTMRGTHQAEFAGIPPTGNSITQFGIDILRIANGKLAEHWDSVDHLSLMQQLGAIP